MAEPALNPGGRVAFVFMSRGFGWANFDVAGLTMLFKMIHVSHWSKPRFGHSRGLARDVTVGQPLRRGMRLSGGAHAPGLLRNAAT